jgi:trehalose 6-phosphate phosphatase
MTPQEPIAILAGPLPIGDGVRIMIRGRDLWRDAGLVRAELQRADLILLALDYDGTLSPIAAFPEDAGMAPETVAVLRDLAASDRFSVAIVSGRSVSDLRRKAQGDLTLVGNHRLEIAGATVSFVHPAAAVMRPVLDHACWDLEAALEGVRGVFVERKGLSATVHYRQAPADLRTWIEATVRATIRPYSRLLVAPALDAWEIRPRVRWNKGSAVRLLAERMAATRPAVLCAGDDDTDEDMFDAWPGQIFIRVNRPRRTKAQYYVRSPAGLLRFLQLVAADLWAGSHSGAPEIRIAGSLSPDN